MEVADQVTAADRNRRSQLDDLAKLLRNVGNGIGGIADGAGEQCANQTESGKQPALNFDVGNEAKHFNPPDAPNTASPLPIHDREINTMCPKVVQLSLRTPTQAKREPR
ncbi:hypothetical protein [Bradyrhizobium aeschynomenes]|uniref:hypothetical protein n=1 Tax=Bradyrhizobium aeschynomenes TaxID=2734909 RepID=UPI0035D81E89